MPISSTLAAKSANSRRIDEIGRLVVHALEEQKAQDILTFELHDASVVADLLVIASGRSRRHVSAISERVVTCLKTAKMPTARPEGTSECTWILIDAGQVVIHIFTPEIRSFYNLERLWSDRSVDMTAGH